MKLSILLVLGLFAANVQAADCVIAATYDNNTRVCKGDKVILAGDMGDQDELPRYVEIVETKSPLDFMAKIIGDSSGTIISGTYVTKVNPPGPVHGFPNLNYHQPFNNPMGSKDVVMAFSKDLWGYENYYVILGELGQMRKINAGILASRISGQVGAPLKITNASIFSQYTKNPPTKDQRIQEELDVRCKYAYGPLYSKAINATNLEVIYDKSKKEMLRDCKVGIPGTVCLVPTLQKFPQWTIDMGINAEVTCVQQ